MESPPQAEMIDLDHLLKQDYVPDESKLPCESTGVRFVGDDLAQVECAFDISAAQLRMAELLDRISSEHELLLHRLSRALNGNVTSVGENDKQPARGMKKIASINVEKNLQSAVGMKKIVSFRDSNVASDESDIDRSVSLSESAVKKAVSFDPGLEEDDEGNPMNNTYSSRSSQSTLQSSGDDDEGKRLALLDCWTIETPDLKLSRVSVMKRVIPKLWYESPKPELAKSKTGNLEEDAAKTPSESFRNIKHLNLTLIDSEQLCGGWLHTIHPHGFRRVLWDTLTMLLIIKDSIFIPLMAFGLNPGDSIPGLVLMDCAFWTADIFLSFFTGIYTDGELVMRFASIAKNYSVTWMPIDVSLVTLEWLMFVGVNLFSGAGFTRAGRYTRILKAARAVKTARLIKLLPILAKLEDSIISLTLLLMFKIVKLIVALIILNHFIACAWYEVGLAFRGWPQMDKYKDASMDFLYMASLQWALAHFLGSILIQGHNTIERVFSVIVCIIALIGSTMFISKVTSVMITTMSLQDTRLKVRRLIYHYLEEHHLSTRLSSRLKQYMKVYGATEMNKEQEAQFLELLPETLLADVRGETRAPVLARHPFLHRYSEMHPRNMVLVCHSAIQETTPLNGEIIFQAGDAASSMYSVASGQLEYTLCMFEQKSGMYTAGLNAQKITHGGWVSEAALWVVWEHLGELLSVESKERTAVFALSSAKFSAVVRRHQDAHVNAAMYAKRFLDCLAKQVWSDYFDDDTLYRTVRTTAFLEGINIQKWTRSLSNL